MSSILETAKKGGFKYYNFDFRNQGWASKEEYEAAKQAYRDTSAMYETVMLNIQRDSDGGAVPVAGAEATSY